MYLKRVDSVFSEVRKKEDFLPNYLNLKSELKDLALFLLPDLVTCGFVSGLFWKGVSDSRVSSSFPNPQTLRLSSTEDETIVFLSGDAVMFRIAP